MIEMVESGPPSTKGLREIPTSQTLWKGSNDPRDWNIQLY